MGLWRKIKNVVADVAEAVEDFVNDMGDSVGDAVETVGDGINDVLNWLGEKVGIKLFFSWLGGIIKGVFSLLGAAIKGVFGIFGGISVGLINIIGGLLTLQGSLILEGIQNILSPIFGTLVVVIGKFVAFIQSIFYIQGFERPLTENEKSQLKRVFKDSLNYYVVRIIEGHSGLFGINPRAFTLGNTIYLKTNKFPIDLLVHESTHAWQYQQTGDRYASDALAAQWFVQDAYNWEREINDRNKKNWAEFNMEAQAEFIQDLWKKGELRDGLGKIIQTGNGSFFNADEKISFGHFKVKSMDYTSIAIEAVQTVRKEWF